MGLPQLGIGSILNGITAGRQAHAVGTIEKRPPAHIRVPRALRGASPKGSRRKRKAKRCSRLFGAERYRQQFPILQIAPYWAREQQPLQGLLPA